MSHKKKILLTVLCAFVAIQFIRPARNSGQVTQDDFIQSMGVPVRVAEIIQTSCYDCHSNTTRYPWYTNIQPVGWFLAKHINDGKAVLNLSEFGSYSSRRQVNKLKAMQENISTRQMPLSSYTVLHKNARISGGKEVLIMQWLEKITDSLSQK